MFIRFLRRKRAQSTLEYVLIITAIVAAIIFASVKIKDRIYGGAGDTLIGTAGEVIGDAAADFNYQN